MKDLSNKNVLITGAGNGIGKLLSIAMAKEGSNIVLWDLNPKSIGMVAKEIGEMGKKAWVYPCDVSKKEEVYKQAEKVQKEVGKIDVLINNAGIVSGKPFLECSDEEMERSIDVNLLAHFWTTKAFLPDMIKTNSGHLVSIASAAGLIGIASLADYSASKFAVVGFDESIRMELRKSKINGVKTTCVCPYYINTGMFDGVKTKFDFLLPLLDQNKVTFEILKAIKEDMSYLKLPPIVEIIPLMRLLPTEVTDWFADFLGLSSSMNEFKGHHGSTSSS